MDWVWDLIQYLVLEWGLWITVVVLPVSIVLRYLWVLGNCPITSVPPPQCIIQSKPVLEQPQESTHSEVAVGDSVEELTRRSIDIGEPPRLAAKKTRVSAKVKFVVAKAKPKKFWFLC